MRTGIVLLCALPWLLVAPLFHAASAQEVSDERNTSGDRWAFLPAFVEELRSVTELPLTTWDERLTTVEADRRLREVTGTRRGGYLGALLVGVAAGFVAAPCTAPVLGLLLVYVAQTKNVLWGDRVVFDSERCIMFTR